MTAVGLGVIAGLVSSENGSRNLMRLSVVIPCFNEAQVLPKTYERLAAVLDEAGETDREVIFVDDGSSDETFRVLCDLQKKHDDVRVLGLSRNFGHQMAVTAGLEEASGDATVIIDADLQDPPEVIGEMLAKWGEDFRSSMEFATVVQAKRDSSS